MSAAIDLAAALEAARIGEATGEHAAVLAAALHDALVRAHRSGLEADIGDTAVAVLYAERDAARAERDAALEEQRRAVARLAEVSAERDRLAAEVAEWREGARVVCARDPSQPGPPPSVALLHGVVDGIRDERDRLLAAVVAQEDARTALWRAAFRPDEALARQRWHDATEATEALGRELRGGGR